MRSGGTAPSSLRRLLAVLAVASAAPLAIGVLLDMSSDSGTLILGSAATRRHPASGARAGTVDNHDPDDGGGTASPSSSGSTTSASPPSTAGPATSTTTTTDPPPSSPTTSAPTTAPPRDPTTTASQAPRSSETDAVVALTNAARAEAGCPGLVVDDRLAAAAQAHSDDMAAQDYFSHTSPDGTTFAERAEAAGYPQPGGENIARGQRSAEAVVFAWMDSPGHRANILNCAFRAIGVGLHEGDWVWVQVFGY